jgi:hypothetical protein
MSRINWIKGELKGKLGEIVGSSWRGISYTKVYTKPTEPHTQGQQEIRGIFGHVGHLAHLVYRDVLDPYMYPIPHKSTKYNEMMRINKDMYDDKLYDPSKIKIMQGSLMLSTIDVIEYVADSEGGYLDVQWDPAGEGERQDDICAVIFYSVEADKVWVQIAKRKTLEVQIEIPPEVAQITPRIHCYIVFSRPPSAPGDLGEVSDTAYAVAEREEAKKSEAVVSEKAKNT